MSTQAAATNTEIATLLGLTHSGVSRIRAGLRHPSFPTMAKIAEEFDWPISKQIDARMAGNYSAEFERYLAAVYGDRHPLVSTGGS